MELNLLPQWLESFELSFVWLHFIHEELQLAIKDVLNTA